MWTCKSSGFSRSPRAWMMVKRAYRKIKGDKAGQVIPTTSQEMLGGQDHLYQNCVTVISLEAGNNIIRKKYVSCTSRWSKMESLLQFLLLTWCSDVRGSGYSSKSFLTPLHNCGTLGKLPNLSVSQFLCLWNGDESYKTNLIRVEVKACHVASAMSVQLLSHVQMFVIPWTAARQASLSFTISRVCPNSWVGDAI